MRLQQPLTLMLATLTAATPIDRRSEPDFRIILTNTTLGTKSVYSGSVRETTVVAGATGTFDQATLQCAHEICLPEYHCVLTDTNSSQSVDLGPGTTQVVCALEVGLITCGWELPDYSNECRARPNTIVKIDG